MDDWYDRLRKQVTEMPPRCLSGFNPRPGEAPQRIAEMCSWELRCSCGNATGHVLGYSLKERDSSYDGPELLLSPLAFECSSCNTITQIIDVAHHGYDAEICKICTTLRGEGPRMVYNCEQCAKREFTVLTSFSHSHFDHIEDEPELAPRAQDFFDGFGCCVTCQSCGHVAEIAGYELA